MKPHARIPWTLRGLILLALLAPTACVWRTEHKIETVSKIDAHIVLDIRQIKEEAAQIEGYVRDENKQPQPAATPAVKPSSWAHTESALRQMLESARGGWLRFSPNACATPALPEVSKEDESKAIEARKARVKEIGKALDAGHLGENDHGYVEALLPKDFPDKDLRAAMDALAKQENADRRTIYIALTRRQGKGADALPAIEMVYAGAIRERLKKGQTYQAPRDLRFFEEYQKTKLGQASPDAKPGQWIRKPIDPPKKPEG